MRTRQVIGVLAVVFALIAAPRDAAAQTSTHGIEQLMRELQARKMIVGTGSGNSTTAYSWPSAQYDGQSCDPGRFPVDGFYEDDINGHSIPLQELANIVNQRGGVRAKFMDISAEFIQEQATLHRDDTNVDLYGYQYFEQGGTDPTVSPAYYESWHFSGANGAPASWYVPSTIDETNVVSAISAMLAAVETFKYRTDSVANAATEGSFWDGYGENEFGESQVLGDWFQMFVPGDGAPWDANVGGAQAPGVVQLGEALWVVDRNGYTGWAGDSVPPSWAAKRQKFTSSGAWKIPADLEIFGYVELMDPTGTVCGTAPVYTAGAPLDDSEWGMFESLRVEPPTEDDQHGPTSKWTNTFSGGGSSGEFDLTANERCTIEGDTHWDFNRGGWTFGIQPIWRFEFSPPVSPPCEGDDKTVPWEIDDPGDDPSDKDNWYGVVDAGCGGPPGPGGALSGANQPPVDLPIGPGGAEGGQAGAVPPDLGKICTMSFPPGPGCGFGYSTDVPVEYRNGFKFESVTDLSVAADGADFSLIRHYTGSPSYVANSNRADNGPSLVGEGWSLSCFMYLDVRDGGDTLAWRSWPSTLESLFLNPSQATTDWLPVNDSPLVIHKSHAWIDGEYWPTWELTYPGLWSMHFVREAEYDDTHNTGYDYDILGDGADDEIAAAYGYGQAYEGFLVGQLLHSTDTYGRYRNYSYYRVDYTIGGNTYSVPRLKVIHLNGSELHFGDADIQFEWLFDGSIPEAIGGQLDEVRVVRRDASGQDLVTQRVDYIYGAESAVASFLSADVADNGTNDDESSELVEVIKYTLVDDAPSGTDPYRAQITQYRYHDESTSSTGDPRLDAYGLRSQLKSVIMPEQVEYYAEHRTGDSWSSADRVYQASLELLGMDDDDAPTSQNWDAGTAPMVVDLAAKVVGYSSTGVVEDQFVQASCGCGGSGQSVQFSYQLESYTVGSSDGRSLIVTEAIDDGSGFADYRRHYYDVVYTGTHEVPLLTSRAVAELDSQGAESRVWAEVFTYDSSGLLATGYTSPSAVTEYVNSPTDQTAPVIEVSGSSGLIYAATYNSMGAVTALSRQKGSGGTPEALYEIEYDSNGLFPTEVNRFRVGASATADETQTLSIEYTYHEQSDGSGGREDSEKISAITISTEADLPAENGPTNGPAAHTTTQLFDLGGHLRWVCHPDGSVDYFDYDASTGRVVTIARNVDPSGQASGSPNPALSGAEYGVDSSSWGRYADGGFAVSTRTYDLLGRLASSTSPTGVTTYVVRDLAEEDVSGSDVYYDRTLRFPHRLGDGSVDGPVSVSWQDAAGRTIRSSGFATDVQGSYDPPTADDVDWEAELSRSTATLSSAGLVMSTSRWLDLDVTGRVAETEYEYDALGRRTIVTDPNGTVRRTEFDVLDRPIESYVGDSSGQQLVQDLYYDSGTQAVRTGIGNGNLTVAVRYTGEDGTLSAATRTSINYYDWRDRLVATQNPESPHQAQRYDNLDRVTASAVYSTLPTVDSDGADLDEEQHRGAYSETLYSQRGLPYRSRVAIDPSQTTLTFLQSDTWYDASGRQLASDAPNGPASVTEYDGLGRAVRAFVTDRAGDTAANGSGSYEDILDPTDDRVIEESTIVFRDDTLPELAYSTQRTHSDASTGEVGLDDGITTFTGSVYDDAARLIATISWGTNASGFEPAGTGGVPTVPSTVPDRDTSPWDETIITEQSYNARGLTETVTDPEGKLTAYLYDDAGRRVAVVENYQSTNDGDDFGFAWDATNGRWEVTGGLSATYTDVNRVTSYTHDLAGNVKYQTAHLPPSGGGTESVQVTEYVYGVVTVLNPSDTDSLITSDSLLKEVRYPDETTGEPGSTAEYKVSYAYNRLGELRSVVDQNGTTHVYSRDGAGRATLDWVSAFGTDVDGQGTDIDDTVSGIEITYDDFGRVEAVQSLDSQPAVLNGVKFGYNSLWQVEDVFQDPYGEVTETNGVPDDDTLVVRYAYSEDATNNHSRITGMTYPDGSLLEYAYGSTTGDTDDLISRVTTLSLDSTDLVVYDHVGLGMFSHVDYAVPDIQLDRTASHDGKRWFDQQTPTQDEGVYPGWDRFGRVVRHLWADGPYDDDPNSAFPNRPPLFETTHSYDRTSNRLTRYDERPGAQMPNWDFEYEYDGLDRLVAADRGEIESSAFTPGIGVQEWTLDMLGNWSNWKRDLDGDGNFTDSQENEDRTHNAANEITSLDIDGLTGTPFTQHSDKAGNWTRNKRSLALVYGYTHDAWNRLVKVEKLQTIPPTLGEYEYNGLHWRTVKRTDGDAERRMFYSASWQLLEERFDSDTTDGGGVFAEEACSQTVWGLRYIDDAVLRRTDTNQDHDYADAGERTDYYLTDPQFSVVAVVDDTGALQERVAYSAYGEARHHYPADMNGDGDADSGDMSWFTNINNLKDIDESGYNPDGDLNRDGSVDSGDVSIASGWNGSAALAKGLISDPDGPDSPIGYDGYVFNAETKLYSVGYRYYEPVTGRWIERDPAPFIDGANLYQYVRSSPISYVDPLGLQPAADDEDYTDTPVPGGRLIRRHYYRRGKYVGYYDYDPDDLADQAIVDKYAHDYAALTAICVGAATAYAIVDTGSKIVGGVVLLVAPGPEDAIFAGLAFTKGFAILRRGSDGIWTKLARQGDGTLMPETLTQRQSGELDNALNNTSIHTIKAVDELPTEQTKVCKKKTVECEEPGGAEHTTGARPSTKDKHQKGQARKQRDQERARDRKNQ